MAEQNVSSPETKAKTLFDIFSDETDLLISTLLAFFGSLNLAQFTRLLHKPKATLHRKLMELIDKQIIEIRSPKRAEEKRVYYQLTKDSAIYFTNAYPTAKLLKVQFKESPVEFVTKLGIAVRSFASLNLAFMSILAENVKIKPELLDDQTTIISQTVMDIQIHSEEEQKEVKKIFEDFFSRIQKYSSDFEHISKPSHNLYITLFPLFKLLPTDIQDDIENKQKIGNDKLKNNS